MLNSKKEVLLSKALLARGRKASILIVDDHPIFRDGLAQLINKEDDLFVAGEADNAPDAIRLLDEINPDLVIVDIMLRESCGIDLVKEINRRRVNVPVLVLSMHDESIFVDRVLKAGAKGYIAKRETTHKVVDAIHQVFNGKVYVSDSMMDNILNRYIRNGTDVNSSPVEALSSREFEVFNLIGQGLTNRQIADMLRVSNKTISTYRERIKNKLNLGSAAELSRYAMRSVETENDPETSM